MFSQAKAIAIGVSTLAIFAAGAAIGYGLRDISAQTEVAELDATHAVRMQVISDAAAEAANKALIEQQNMAEQIAAIDESRTEEIERAKTEINELRNDIRAGTRRLSIFATCPAVGSGMPTAAQGTGVDNDATRAELDPKAAERVVAIASDGDSAIRQLSACQEYVKTITKN